MAQVIVHDHGIIAAHDNMVAINSAIMVDLTGQIAAESVGPRMTSGTGGQLAFAVESNYPEVSVISLPFLPQQGMALYLALCLSFRQAQ